MVSFSFEDLVFRRKLEYPNEKFVYNNSFKDMFLFQEDNWSTLDQRYPTDEGMKIKRYRGTNEEFLY